MVEPFAPASPCVWKTIRMRLLLLSLCASLAVACAEPTRDVGGSPPTAAAPSGPRDHRKLVADGAALVDVRSPDEFGEGHVQGARNIPVATLAGRLAEIPKDKPVVVYCAAGSRSAAAARTLKAAGYDVVDLGAMRNW